MKSTRKRKTSHLSHYAITSPECQAFSRKSLPPEAKKQPFSVSHFRFFRPVPRILMCQKRATEKFSHSFIVLYVYSLFPRLLRLSEPANRFPAAGSRLCNFLKISICNPMLRCQSRPDTEAAKPDEKVLLRMFVIDSANRQHRYVRKWRRNGFQIWISQSIHRKHSGAFRNRKKTDAPVSVNKMPIPKGTVLHSTIYQTISIMRTVAITGKAQKIAKLHRPDRIPN